MAFKALNEVFDGRLALPGKDGKIYHIPEPDAELGAWCTAMFTAGVAITMGDEPPAGVPSLQLDDDDEMALYRRVLGDTLDELQADGYGHATIKHFGQTAFIWIAVGQESAEAFWNSGGDPKASLPRPLRRGQARQGTASTPRTAAASTTPKVVSTSGTKPRKAPSKAPAARPSRGK